MMPINVGINGFGRIGRSFFRAIQNNSDIRVKLINDITDTEMLGHLLKYDSVHGKLEKEISVEGDTLRIGEHIVTVSNESEPKNIKWKEADVDYVIEATGLFRTKESASAHIKAGAKKVIITAPGKEVDATFVVGVNEETYNPTEHHVVSNASCTTNCVAPVAKILYERFGIKRGMMTTVHSYTTDQQILDLPHKDYRRARAAAMNIIPTTTGALTATGFVLPALKGKLTGGAIRVPTPNVSLIDFVVELEKNDTTVMEINEAFKEAAKGELRGILAYSDEPLVSGDYNSSSYSAIVDGLSTQVLDGNLVKVIAWYDNEFGYSNRVADLVMHMSQQ